VCSEVLCPHDGIHTSKCCLGVFSAISHVCYVVSRAIVWQSDVCPSFSNCFVQVLLDSPDGDGDSSQMGEQSVNDGFGAGPEWLKWTELVPQEETIANCWTEIIDVESGEERVSNVEQLKEFESHT
jgi:hypothetical protein